MWLNELKIAGNFLSLFWEYMFIVNNRKEHNSLRTMGMLARPDATCLKNAVAILIFRNRRSETFFHKIRSEPGNIGMMK